ncbi:ricin-type beta-trefoil lectin domain protein [Salinibacterium hongtaonis]|uniref:ricin-type beta-trefoil lectin domain protein n=1 Tax=Homoserinimonas hongtaonis TaxID=2079791 RepID=UPI000D3A6F7E|nr:ricin-type beta-trefoil lectin domain protein [Salinibacterium hongtaonis]AWB90009.1 hypothetical protein C2138_11060 [Salinibacterium hongtaonis]
MTGRQGFITMARRLSPEGRRRDVLRRSAQGEEGVALVSTVFFIVMLAGLSFVLLGVILGQIGPAYAAAKSTRTVYAAQAGLQSALGTIRAASKVDLTGTTVGDRTKLSCGYSGSVDGAGADARYTVSIRYYTADPTGRTDSWLEANKMNCTSAGVATQPSYAYVVSRGADDSAEGRSADEGNRALSATYKFKVTNVNIPGGRIFNFDKTRCLQAKTVGGVAAPGVEIEFVTACSTNDERQLWVYDANYQIVLANSTLAGTKLCVTSKTTGSGGSAAATTGRTTLEPCRTDSTRFSQLFSWEGTHSWYVSKNPISAGPTTICLGNSGNYLQTGSCGTFAPAPSVGAGAASYGTTQIVNYLEFGRCLDVTDLDIAKSFMISYPCKQDPSGSGAYLAWNHKWFYTEASGSAVSTTGTIMVRVDNSTSKQYCLTSPTTASGGKYPLFTSCSASNARQTWQRIKNNGEYSSSYVFMDNAGRCLQADGNDKYNSQWSRIIVTVCDGGLDQKWNAPSISYDSTFGGFKELGE